jgi:hypothetical protein
VFIIAGAIAKRYNGINVKAIEKSVAPQGESPALEDPSRDQERHRRRVASG